MTVVDIIITVLIALYAMIGGAFLNAAITAPENCLRVLQAARSGWHYFVFQAGYLAIAAYSLVYCLGWVSDREPGAIAYAFTASHMMLEPLLIACGYVARSAHR